MRVSVSHTTRLEYTAEVEEAVMDVRLGPLSDADQSWHRFELRVSPTAAVRRYEDGFDNVAHLVSIARLHRQVELTMAAEVETLLADPLVPLPAPARPLGPLERADYLGPSVLVPSLPQIEAMAAPLRPGDPAATFESVQRLMELVHDGFSYSPNSTTVTTTVAEVLAGGSGVCQDFAHLLIGLCRAVAIPARYVSGYVVSPRRPGQSQRQGAREQRQAQPVAAGDRAAPERGAGASHAWVEAYTSSHGWRGFDPTNNLLVGTYHVKMAIGRDYRDVPPTRGTFRGAAEERLTVRVSTEHLD